ncbi:MAG: BACON domain-containing protein, partial [Planctomycetota bacterium]
MLDPTEQTFDSLGASGEFQVDIATEICTWTATVEEGVDWISIDAGSESGTGDGTVLFTVAENPELDERTGAILVEGVEFTV